ncbi:AsmA family protein [Photobacterium sp. TY1-4]|uniref:AsmA family protein n=1 Tax=Photobacterium sp. TY1-4 TaxID=2899122 RepID=UPI0021C16B48|nr:AsmA family protein [Photobacterium sp. TY1-4]UXI00319.1 AsmA family protein [Photobacterium sp. TY1-4]
MKKLLYVVFAIIIVVVVGIGALLALVDPNQFKPLITEQVKKATGRDLVISGDLSWRFFPSIGLALGKTEFRNPDGFAEPNLVQISSAELSVSVLPLLSRHLEIGNVRLEDSRVFIQTRLDGISNLDGLGQAAQEAAETPAAEPQVTEAPVASEEAVQPWSISLEGVELVNASAVIRDDQAGTETSVSALNFALSRFAPGEWAKANFDVAGKNGELAFTAQGETELLIVPTLDNAELKNVQFAATAKDAAMNIESASLTMDQFKAGDWSTLTFAAKGAVPDLAFDAEGQTRLKLNQAMNDVMLEGLVLSSKLQGATLPRPEMAVKLNADLQYDVQQGLATLSRFETSVDELALTGNGSFKNAAIPQIRFALSSDNIDLDAFLGLDQAKAEAQTAATNGASSETPSDAPASDTAKAEAAKNQEPDLSALKTLDVAGTVSLGKLKAANAKLANVLMDVKIDKGVLTLKQLDADLYDGHIRAEATIDANGKLPRYFVTKTITGVQVQPLLVDLVDNDVLAGKGDILIKLGGTGLAENRIRQNVAGTVDISFADGAINGINIPAMIRKAKATLKGKRDELEDEAKKTDFSAMTATIQLGKGIASTNNLDIDSPLLRVDGAGETSLVKETIDFGLDTSLVATSKGQGGKQVDEVADITVPIDIKGNWTEPKVSLDMKRLLARNNELEQKAKKELDRGLEKILGEKAKDEEVQKVKDKLLEGLGLFN